MSENHEENIEKLVHVLSRKLDKMIKALKTSLRDGRKADVEGGSPWRHCAVCAFTPELHRRFLGGRTLCFLYTDVLSFGAQSHGTGGVTGK